MLAEEKIESLEKRISVLENENLLLKSMWKEQVGFGVKITKIVSEMDQLLEKKKLEIESLTNRLLANEPDPELNDFKMEMPEDLNDFTIDLSEPSTIEPKTQIDFFEHQERVRMNKERLEKEFEKTQDGRFKCPFKDICTYTSKSRQNLRMHIYIHTGEKPYSCGICGRCFTQQSACKKHILTHPGMKGVQCDYCRTRISESQIEIHAAKCKLRKQVKRSRMKSEPDTAFFD